jgi:hypothetical protein
MQEYSGVIAAFINSVAVLGVVQFLKVQIPALNQKIPWVLPILAGAVGPGIATLQNFLSSSLGVPIDLSPIVGIFTGGTAVAIFQVGKQATKGAEVPAQKG